MKNKLERPPEIPDEVEVLDDDFDDETSRVTSLEPKVKYSGSDEDLTMLGLYSPNNEDFNK
jgi:hypothetical protein